MTALLYWAGCAMLALACIALIFVPLISWLERRADARDKAAWDLIQRRGRL